MSELYQVIITFVILVVSISLYATYHYAATAHRNILLGVLLPLECQKKPEVLQVIDRYRKINLVIFILSLIAGIPIFFIQYVSFNISYMTIWFAASMAAANHNFNYNFSRLILLKSENKWFTDSNYFHPLIEDQESVERNKIKSFIRKIFPSTKDKLLKKAEQPIYIDEDEYWINGYYYNPEDKRVNIEKRTGYGSTINMATKGGKVIAYGITIFITALLLTLVILFFRMDFVKFQINIIGDNVNITAPLYGYQFQLADIEDITLIQTLPEHGIRTNGAATATYLLGNFNYSEYGSTKMFIYQDYPPYMVIRLKDKTVFFNTKSVEQTQKYYELLSDLKDNKG
jgi:hypothetical protein